MNILYCYNCNYKNEYYDKVGRSHTCEKCDNDLHCCRNCIFYDDSFNNSCKETAAEIVTDKEKANFCEFFKASNKISKKENPKNSSDIFNSLFKK